MTSASPSPLTSPAPETLRPETVKVRPNWSTSVRVKLVHSDRLENLDIAGVG
jgi:hypothetical protein